MRTVAALFGVLLLLAGGVLALVAATAVDEPGDRGVAIMFVAGVAAVVIGGVAIVVAKR